VSEERGFVAIEWVAAIAFLLLPMVVLVASLPVWAERRNAATIAAREAARVLVDEWPHANAGDAIEVAREVAANDGVRASDLAIALPDDLNPEPGDAIEVDVTVTMPAIAVAGMRVGAWHYRAVSVRRIDDYRSK
jgi:hypothetical protein